MNYSSVTKFGVLEFGVPALAGSSSGIGRLKAVLRAFVLGLCFLPLPCFAVVVNPEITISDDQTTIIVNDTPEQDIISFGKSVVVQKRAKGVLAIGGDIIIEGRVEGDVATMGGNIIQKKDSYIGGDVFVFGGSYKPESETPLRGEGKQTVIFGVFEEELRNFGKNPSDIFAPSLTIGFLAQRLVIALFWFVISLVFTTLAPGAVSRAVARTQLSPLKIGAIGAGSFLLIAFAMIGGTLVLPNYLSATLVLMGVTVMLLGFVFGRVVLQVSVGKLIQKHFLAGNNRSETLAILIGVLAWTLLLSLPYVWIIALFAIFAAGVGLVLTGRTSPKWQNP